MTIRAVVFDLGHTLWDIGPGDGALERAYEDMHAGLAERLGRGDLPSAIEFQHAVRDALTAAMETYFRNDFAYSPDGIYVEQPPTTRWVDEGFRSLGIALDDALLREITPALFATEIDSLMVAEGTLEAVRDLSAAGYVLGCVTNTLADTEAIRAMLRRYEIEDLMHSVVVSADEGWRKPHPSLFEKALRDLGTAPHETVFVGDSPLHDVAGAKAAGMYAVLTQQYKARPYEQFDPKPDAVIGHLRELRNVIATLESSMAR